MLHNNMSSKKNSIFQKTICVVRWSEVKQLDSKIYIYEHHKLTEKGQESFHFWENHAFNC